MNKKIELIKFIYENAKDEFESIDDLAKLLYDTEEKLIDYARNLVNYFLDFEDIDMLVKGDELELQLEEILK